jgi:CDP-glucose 4,6-dehydratase
MTYAHSYDMPVVVARCGNIYGGGDLNWSRIVPGTIRSLWRGETADHPQQRAVHARLHLRAGRGRRLPGAGRAAATTRRQGRGVQLQPGDARQRARNHQSIQRFTAARISSRSSWTRPGRDQGSVSRLGEGAARLGWAPNWSLEAGLTETIAWYRRFLDAGARQAALAD